MLKQLQRRRLAIAIVVNEFGEVEGLATLEDLLEEIVGEIRDEYDREERGPVERLLNNPAHEPMFIDAENGDPMLRELSAKVGAKATIIVPLATVDALLGLLVVSVTERAERLKAEQQVRQLHAELEA